MGIVRGRAVLAALCLVACGDDGAPGQETGTGTADTGTTSVGDGGSTDAGEDATPTTSGGAGTTSGDGGATDDGVDESSSGGAGIVVEDPIRVAFVASAELGGVDELWLFDEAQADAGALRLSHALPREAFVSPYLPRSPDGGWLLYRTVRPGPGTQHELRLVDVSTAVPGAAVRIDASGELVHEYDLSPDGAAAMWIGPSGIHRVPLTDPSPDAIVELTPAPTDGGAYGLFELGADGSAAAYTADPDGSGVDNAFVVPTRGGAPELRSDLTAAGTAVDGNSLELLPDGALLYEADRDVAEPELFWSGPGGPDPIKVNGALVDEQLRTVRVAPDASAVAFWTGVPGSPDLGTVWVAALDADGPDAPVAVHEGQLGDPQSGRLVWSADASALLYVAFATSGFQSWVVDVAAGVPGTPVRVVPDGSEYEEIVAHYFSPTGGVLFVSEANGTSTLRYAALDGGGAVVVSPTGSPGRSGDLRFSPDGSEAIFTGFVDSATERDLYRIDLGVDPPFSVTAITSDLPPMAEVGLAPEYAGDGAHVLFTITDPATTARHLYDAPPGGTGFEGYLPLWEAGFVISWTALPPAP